MRIGRRRHQNNRRSDADSHGATGRPRDARGHRFGPTQEDVAEAAGQMAYGVGQAGRLFVNLARGRKPAPDYVTFTIDGRWPELPAPRRRIQQLILPPADSLRLLRLQLRAVAADPRLKGIVLHIRPVAMSRAELETLRDLIAEVRSAGKRVVVWSSRLTTGTYFVACAADEIVLQPGGEITPIGLRRSYFYLADALDKAGLKFDGVQISPYKSAGDMLGRTEMSDEVREMADWLIDADYDGFVRAVAQGRSLDDDGARAFIDGAPYTDLEALEAGAIDAILGEEDLASHLTTGDEPPTLETFAKARKKLFVPQMPKPGRYVALMRIEGSIVDGKSNYPPTRPPGGVPLVAEPRAGDLTVVQAARRVLADDRAAALVIYIDSPGGSATASEAMAAALSKVAEKKPVIAAMGTVAASGGYYVATPAKWIFAQPGTITGSIGVLSGKIVTSGLLDRLQFHRETISRGANIGMYDAEDPFDEAERAMVWQGIERTYDVFVDRVSASRDLTHEVVDSIGGGRVWTGEQALHNGLVDELGSLEDALANARALAGISRRAPVVEIGVPKVPLAPAMDPTAILRYMAESVELLNTARTLTLCPMIWTDEV